MQNIKHKSVSILKNKRGTIKITLEELIGALLFVIVGYLIYIVVVKLTGIVLPGKSYESTVKSFELLTNRISQLTKDKNFANTNFLYFIDKNFILVGFNYKDPSIVMKSCDGESLINTRKKIGSLCQGACLCIYKNTWRKNFDEDLQNPLECKDFDKNMVFLTPSEQKDTFCSTSTGWNPKAYLDYYQLGEGYKFLILKGFNTKEIYLDKYESSDGNIFIFLAEFKNDMNDPIYKRKLFMEENYENSHK